MQNQPLVEEFCALIALSHQEMLNTAELLLKKYMKKLGKFKTKQKRNERGSPEPNVSVYIVIAG